MLHIQCFGLQVLVEHMDSQLVVVRMGWALAVERTSSPPIAARMDSQLVAEHTSWFVESKDYRRTVESKDYRRIVVRRDCQPAGRNGYFCHSRIGCFHHIAVETIDVSQSIFVQQMRHIDK